MTDDQDVNRYFSGSVYRLLSGLFGLCLTGLGIYIVFFGAVGPLINLGAGLLVTSLGVEAVWSAIRSTQSWLAGLSLFF